MEGVEVELVTEIRQGESGAVNEIKDQTTGETITYEGIKLRRKVQPSKMTLKLPLLNPSR